MERSDEDVIKDRYTALRRQFHPGYTPNDQKTGRDWDAAAAMARALGADPSLFVDAQFHSMSMSSRGPFPWPSDLHNRNAAGNYESYMTHFASTPAMRLDQQNKLLSAQLDELSLRQIDIFLSKADLPFKSWFRILMCSDKNYPMFKRVWGDSARAQMRNDKGLLKFLTEKYAERAHRLL